VIGDPDDAIAQLERLEKHRGVRLFPPDGAQLGDWRRPGSYELFARYATPRFQHST